jgi:hypothetical protein
MVNSHDKRNKIFAQNKLFIVGCEQVELEGVEKCR